MTLETWRMLVDFGLVVLIWIVQLVVYPSFQYYSRADLMRWHERYTSRVTIVVLPLMVAQLAISVMQLAGDMYWFSVVYFVLVALMWVSTFVQFVPLHGKISSGLFDSEVTEGLVRKNWVRTVIWTVIFVLGVVG